MDGDSETCTDFNEDGNLNNFLTPLSDVAEINDEHSDIVYRSTLIGLHSQTLCSKVRFV